LNKSSVCPICSILDFRRLALGALALADEIAADDAHHDPDQHQYNEYLDQRHAARARQPALIAVTSHDFQRSSGLARLA
jgi:hypothetical protein